MPFSATLINWYTNNKRDLPWRNTTNPYFIWLSEIILQQTQVAQGLPYYLAFTQQYPTIFSLANAPESAILKLWQGLGYYSRARNLHHAAKTIVQHYNGEFPTTYNQLITLKGIGDYTASAIASICFKAPTAVVDGNVYRFLARYFGIKTPINSSEGIKIFKTLAQKLIDPHKPDVFNQAIMEFGALQCKPQNPNCTTCPFIENCVANREDSIAFLPNKIKPKPVKKEFYNFLVILSKSQTVILEQRKHPGIWQNLYQFPLIISSKNASLNTILPLISAYKTLQNKAYTVKLYNAKSIVHKLSHKHLYTKFWIIITEENLETSINIENLKHYAVPVLISRFMKSFNFKDII